eukprot:snap_masked-scaffold_4-processed-gene-12.17-mRNA-1 protein AED:1.00 eAED:1.00 QI:0/0/0/0/1/1/2/0/176
MSADTNINLIPTNLLSTKKDSPMYMSEKNRFTGSFVAEERERRLKKLEKEKFKLEKKQDLHRNLREMRKRHEEIKTKAWDERLKYLQKKGSPKNNPSVPYNPLTLEYDNSPQGRRLKYEDEKTIYRAKLRSKKIYFEANRNGYNPINGESVKYRFDTKGVQPPTKPFDFDVYQEQE